MEKKMERGPSSFWDTDAGIETKNQLMSNFFGRPDDEDGIQTPGGT
jgi:hypothetical protein